MADAAMPNHKQLRIAKLKLPTLATQNIQTHPHVLPIHFHLRSEAHKAPPLLAALFSNKTFGSHGSHGAPLQNPSFAPNDPLKMFTELFAEIKQELGMEARKFYCFQREYLKECIRRSRSPVNRKIKTPEAVSPFRSNLSFLVRLLFEIMEGEENRKFKGACEMPSLPDIYSNKDFKAGNDMASVAENTVTMQKHLTVSASYQTSPVSGFNTLFTNKRK